MRRISTRSSGFSLRLVSGRSEPLRERVVAARLLPAGELENRRRFWEAMDAIEEERLKEIERRIVAKMVETFGVDMSGLVLAMDELHHLDPV